MIVNGRGKLKSCAGLVCLFSKQSTMQTNLPCKQIENKQGMWQHHSPPPKKTNPTDQKHPRDRSNEGKKGKTNVVLLIVPLSKRCKAIKNRLMAPHHPRKKKIANCPATEEVQSNQKQA